jgi:hypothetical protein
MGTCKKEGFKNHCYYNALSDYCKGNFPWTIPWQFSCNRSGIPHAMNRLDNYFDIGDVVNKDTA